MARDEHLIQSCKNASLQYNNINNININKLSNDIEMIMKGNNTKYKNNNKEFDYHSKYAILCRKHSEIPLPPYLGDWKFIKIETNINENNNNNNNKYKITQDNKDVTPLLNAGMFDYKQWRIDDSYHNSNNPYRHRDYSSSYSISSD